MIAAMSCSPGSCNRSPECSPSTSSTHSGSDAGRDPVVDRPELVHGDALLGYSDTEMSSLPALVTSK
jgi:hypothetical protein